MTKTISIAEYSAVRAGGAGLIDLSSRGRILVSGSEAVMFLNGLITNDMKTLAAGSWMPAAFANVQGRLLAAARVIHRQDGFLIDTERQTHDTVLQTLDRFTLAGDFRVADVTSESASISIQGRSSEEIIRRVLGETAAVERQKVFNANLANGREVTLIRATHTAEDGFDLIAELNDIQNLRELLLKMEVQSVGDETFETLRIEAGIPRYGLDMDDANVVTETNLDEAVSFTKGCYLEQEIIVRIKHRGHVAKKLAGIIVEERSEVENGAQILSAEGREIGRVKSSTFSPRLDRTIALGYVKYDFLSPGTAVRVQTDGGEMASKVAELPFVRGSWYGGNHG